MAEVVRDSTAHLNNIDLNTIATYLKDCQARQRPPRSRSMTAIGLPLPAARLSTQPIASVVTSRADKAWKESFRHSRAAPTYKRKPRPQFCRSSSVGDRWLKQRSSPGQ